MLCNVMSCYVVFCRVMLCFVMLCRVMLWHVMLCYVMLSCYFMQCDVKFCSVALCYVTVRVTIFYVLLRYVMFFRWCDVMLCHLVFCFVILCCVSCCYVLRCHVLFCYVTHAHVEIMITCVYNFSLRQDFIARLRCGARHSFVMRRCCSAFPIQVLPLRHCGIWNLSRNWGSLCAQFLQNNSSRTLYDPCVFDVPCCPQWLLWGHSDGAIAGVTPVDNTQKIPQSANVTRFHFVVVNQCWHAWGTYRCTNGPHKMGTAICRRTLWNRTGCGVLELETIVDAAGEFWAKTNQLRLRVSEYYGAVSMGTPPQVWPHDVHVMLSSCAIE